jgi:probable rRNA maturation factor
MSGITLLIEESRWRTHRGLRTRLKNAAERAAAAAKLKGAFTILLTDDKKLRTLNYDFRGKDKPTNVLSFPGAGDYFDGRTAGRSTSADAHAGDIAIAYGITRKEATAAGKSFADHAIHLTVHGVLHLAGYDHERPKDARAMEPLEVKILKRLGIADPYAPISTLQESPL